VLAQALAIGSAGGVGCYVDLSGRLVAAPLYDGSDLAMFGAGSRRGTIVRGAPPVDYADDVVERPTWSVLDRSSERPRTYRVRFDAELELRLDYAGDEARMETGTGTQTPGLRPPEELLTISTVAPETWPGGGGVYSPVATVLARADAQRIWRPAVSGLESPTVADLRRLALGPGLEAWTDPQTDLDGAAGTAAHAIMASFRRRYRLSRDLRESIAWVEARRAAGSGGPGGVVWADHTVILTERGVAQEEASASGATLSMLRARYAAGGPFQTDLWRDTRLEDMARAPWTLAVTDAGLGLLALEEVPDRTGARAALVPGTVEPDRTVLAGLDSTAQLLDHSELREIMALSVVVTVGLGAPADERGLYAIELDAAGLAEAPCLGPAREVRVGWRRAAFAWRDDLRDQVVRVLRGEATPGEALATALLDPDGLRLAAESAALADLRPLRDRADGSRTLGGIRPMTPRGGVLVSYEVAANGATTTVAASGDAPPPDEAAFVDPAGPRGGLA
jgi:hypothetical protein